MTTILFYKWETRRLKKAGVEEGVIVVAFKLAVQYALSLISLWRV